MWLKKLPTVSPGKFSLVLIFSTFKSESFLTPSKFITSKYRWLNFLANKKTRNDNQPFLSLQFLNFVESQFSHISIMDAVKSASIKF